MLAKSISGLKLKRTYPGGSRSNEKSIFRIISGLGENSDWEKFNWFEIRQLSSVSFQDTLNVMMSWMRIFEYISIAFAFTSISFVFLSLEITLLLFLISLFFHAFHMYLVRKQEHTREKFEIKIEIIDNQIERLTGMKLPKIKFD